MMMILLTTLGFVGLLDSLYIFYKKQRQEKLACFIGQDCNEVVTSKYSHIYGVPNEVLGIIFYILVLGLVGLVALGTTQLYGIPVLSAVHAVAFVALLLSLYLTAIQAFVLKSWCEYCLVVMLTNFGIFVLVYLIL